MAHRFKHIGEHQCRITNAEEDCWPTLTPKANCLQRTIRNLRKFTLPSYHHPQAKYVYKSNLSFRNAKLHMIYECSPFVLHPFSVLAMIRLLCYFFFMLVYFVIFTFRLYFRLYTSGGAHFIVMKVIQAFFILTQFMVGEVTNMESNNEIRVLFAHKQIAIQYISRYFFLDILECLSIFLIFIKNETIQLWLNFVIFHIFIIGMIYRFSYTGPGGVYILLNRLYNFRHKNFMAFLIFIGLCMHYMTCFRHGWYMFIKFLDGDYNSREESFYFVQYLQQAHYIFMSLYKTVPQDPKENNDEILLIDCICVICTFCLNIYIVVYMLIAARSTNKSKYKYTIMWNNVNNFLKTNRIGGKLRHKIMIHYQHKYQYKFFEEARILQLLSQHLQFECRLHTCTHLINNTVLLRGLSKVAIGKLVSSLKHLVYFPNDVIQTWQNNFDGIYFISYGTLAIYNDQGKEIMHLDDGGVVGAIGYYSGKNVVTTVSVTLTELYKLEIQDLAHLETYCPLMCKRLKTIGQSWLTKVSGRKEKLSLTKLVKPIWQETRTLRNKTVEEEEFHVKNI